jgi:UDP-glucuronate 4-epimerase
MRAIVTGSSGFIGAAVAQKLIREKWEVVGIDCHSNYYSTDLKKARLNDLVHHQNFTFEGFNLLDRDRFSKIVRNFRPDTVFHLAAQAGVRLPVNQIDKYVESNLSGFSSVLQTVALEKVPNFLYASSSSVYGDMARIPYSESEKSLSPNSFYGATKLSNEVLSHALIRHSESRARGLRFFTVYGPNGRPDMAYFRIIANLVTQSKFELFGDGTVERDFTYIDDCVEMIYKLNQELSTNEEGFSDLVNVGGGYPVSINQLIQLASRYLNRELVFEQTEGNTSDAARTMADTTYLKSLVGTSPMTRIETGLKKTIDWASNLPNSRELGSWARSSL